MSHIRVCLAYDCLVCTEGPLLRYAIQHTVGQCQPSRVNWVGCGRKGIRHKILGWNVGYQIDGGVRRTVHRAVYRTDLNASVNRFITTSIDDHDEEKRRQHNHLYAAVNLKLTNYIACDVLY